MGQSNEYVMTVCGPIAPAELGFTHSHEHVLWDYWNLIPSYESIFDEKTLALRELELYRAAGGEALVDCTAVGIGPQPQILQELSRDAEVHIVLGCGWYRERVYPSEVFEYGSRNLGELLTVQLNTGLVGTSVRPGFIGEIGTERGVISPAEERVFRAAAFAQLETGVSIWTHTTHFGELALEQIDLLTECGVQPDRIVVSHLGDRVEFQPLLEIAKRGVFMSIDNIGYRGDGYPEDAVRAQNVVALIERGFLNQIVLGTDVAQKSALRTSGGRGYLWLIEEFLPRLVEMGVTEQQVKQIMVANVAAALTIAQ